MQKKNYSTHLDKNGRSYWSLEERTLPIEVYLYAKKELYLDVFVSSVFILFIAICSSSTYCTIKHMMFHEKFKQNLTSVKFAWKSKL